MGILIRSNVEWKTVLRKTGEILSEGKKHNLIVDTGLIQVAKLINGYSATPFVKIAIGTDSTPPQISNISLASQEDIKDADVDYEIDNKTTFSATFTFVSGIVLKEAGVFVTDAGIMLNRVTFDDQNVGSGVDFHIKFTITVGRV